MTVADALFSNPLAALLSIPILTLVTMYVYYVLYASRYWSRRGVWHLKPCFVLGNLWRVGFTENIMTVFENWHKAYCDRKILGFWMFQKPSLLVMDLDIVKQILVSDFNKFRDRGIEIDTTLDPLAGHLFLLHGKQWRNLRVKLTPTFTSGKMKLMFPTMRKCGEELQEHLRGSSGAVEVKDLMARFTTDIISSCAFGLETNSLKNPNSEFRSYGKRIFQGSLRSRITNIFNNMSPSLLKLFRIRVIPKDVSDFFIGAVRDTIAYREQNKVSRNDFLQLLIQLIRAGKVEDADKTPVDGMNDEETINRFALHEAAAQCFVFFAAGFETSSTALTFCLYELALNKDIQKKLQKEIDDNLGVNEEITYEKLMEMEYLDMVVNETLRKHPPVGSLQRKCGEDFHISELGMTIPKGVTLFVSVLGIHHDPQHYPDPERFDPERFSRSVKMKRNHFAFLPFGEGPRNCIGNRFGLMQIKCGLVFMMRQFTVDTCKDTPIPVVYDVTSFIPTPVGGMPLVFKKRGKFLNPTLLPQPPSMLNVILWKRSDPRGTYLSHRNSTSQMRD